MKQCSQHLPRCFFDGTRGRLPSPSLAQGQVNSPIAFRTNPKEDENVAAVGSLFFFWRCGRGFCGTKVVSQDAVRSKGSAKPNGYYLITFSAFFV